ncbi:hypothetical protein [Tuberibacillus sp. Marseille-P3662]|uniref:hypothetical protein n=1 Tax=Tuberibacillus sp. Marseille-P3662 TaxID=1965358 RepID=UPI000A1CED04|nr:hypothetical protein [Tuberibacillus sp. Marseille-P3662]
MTDQTKDLINDLRNTPDATLSREGCLQLADEVERLIKDKELMLKRVQQIHASMTQALDSMHEHDYPDAIYILSQEAGGEDE